MSALIADARLEALRLSVEEANAHSAHGRPQQAAEVLGSLLAQAPWSAELRQGLNHNLATAWRQVAAQHLESGDTAAALDAMQRLLAVDLVLPLPPERLHARAEIVHHLGADLMRAGKGAAALVCLRKAIALYPCPSFSNNIIAALDTLRQPALLSDYCDTLEPRQIAPHLLLACQPKSASTFLRNVLCEVTGFRPIYLCHHTELAAQDLFYPILLEFAAVPTVTHQHCRASAANVQLMQAFAIRPLVLTRNLHDVLVSLREFLTAGAIRGTRFEVDAWMQASPQRQLDQLIDLVVPWHLEFLAGWQACAGSGQLAVGWLTYRQLMADTTGAITQVLAMHGLPINRERIEGAIATVASSPASNRFNRGVEGRGRAALTAAQQARILAMAGYFPSADFSPMEL